MNGNQDLMVARKIRMGGTYQTSQDHPIIWCYFRLLPSQSSIESKGNEDCCKNIGCNNCRIVPFVVVCREINPNRTFAEHALRNCCQWTSTYRLCVSFAESREMWTEGNTCNHMETRSPAHFSADAWGSACLNTCSLKVEQSGSPLLYFCDDPICLDRGIKWKTKSIITPRAFCGSLQLIVMGTLLRSKLPLVSD